MPSKKTTNSKDKKPQTVESLIDKLARIDKKLDLFFTLSKSMPAIFIASFGILFTTVYLSSVAKKSTNDFTLPETGEEIEYTENFKILLPEAGSKITLPYEILVVSMEGTLQNHKIEIFRKTENNEAIKIGEPYVGTARGEYRLFWNENTSGTKTIFVKAIDLETGKETQSPSYQITILGYE